MFSLSPLHFIERHGLLVILALGENIMGITHFVLLFGIMFTAATLEVAIHHPTHPAPAATAWNLGLDLSIFYIGDVLFRRAMGIDPSHLRTVLALTALLTIPIGLNYSALWQLLACALLNVLVTYIEDYVLEPKREAAGHS